MLKLCLYGPYTNFNLASAIWETNIFQNCTGLLAEISAITRELCFLSLSCHLRKNQKEKKNQKDERKLHLSDMQNTHNCEKLEWKW